MKQLVALRDCDLACGTKALSFRPVGTSCHSPGHRPYFDAAAEPRLDAEGRSLRQSR